MKTKPFNIDGVEVFDVNTFAKLTRKSRRTIYTYIHIGNSIRKLHVVYVMDKPYVKASEFLSYPFTRIGPNSSSRVYHFMSDGTEKSCTECSMLRGDAHAS